MKKTLFMAVVSALSLAGCSETNELKPDPTDPSVKEIEWGEDDLRSQEADIYNNPRSSRRQIVLGDAQKSISRKMNIFSWELFAKVFDRKETPNLLLSPYSLTQDLLMMSNGLRGNSLEEVKLAFGVSDFEMEELNQYSVQMNKGLDEADSRSKYRTDNSVWYKNKLTMRPEFSQTVKQYYRAEIFSAAMNNRTRDSINSWAKYRTFGRIRNFLENIEPKTQSIMVNTVYFRGQWENELKTAQNVRTGTFRNENGVNESVKMVMYHGDFRYSENTSYQSTYRFLGNGAYVMDFILPKEGVKPEAALAQYIQDDNPNMYGRYVKLDFPRFESGTRMQLTETLEAMGIKKMFKSEDANGVCIFDTPSALGGIQQQTTIIVNETGVECASATANIMASFDTNPTPPDTVVMKLERPFFYTIRERSTDTPLFIGYQGSVK